ncbi:MAG: hypothetical protein IKR25_08975, partial [Muribaculaceae bacterium]|nr:hypothetical protein [Muribaculaceae bacterium]
SGTALRSAIPHDTRLSSGSELDSDAKLQNFFEVASTGRQKFSGDEYILPLKEVKTTGTGSSPSFSLPRSEQEKQTHTSNFKRWFGDHVLATLYNQAIRAWNSKDSKGRFNFAPSARAASRFKELLGHEVTTLVITDDTIRHIKNRHGNDESRGQVSMTPEDVLLLPYMINNFDSMELSPKYNDKMGNRAIEIRKRINGTTVIATIEKGKNNEHVVTSWKYKKSDALDAQSAPGLYVQNDSDLAKVQQEIETIKQTAKNSSKIVDENGQPLIVYHGTSADFTAFDRSYIGRTDFGSLGSGFYFTPDEYYARSLAGHRGKVMAVYLDVKRPLIVDGGTSIEAFCFGAKSPEEVMSRIRWAANGDTKIENELMSQFDDGMIERVNSQYDGVIAQRADGSIREICVRDPEQIKSATENNGGFSPANPDIRFSITPTFYSNAEHAAKAVKQPKKPYRSTKMPSKSKSLSIITW